MDVQFDEEELEDLEARVTGLWLDDLFAVHQRAQERKIPQPRPPRPTIIRAKDDIEKAADKLREKWAADLAKRFRDGARRRRSRMEAERIFAELQTAASKPPLPFVVQRVRKRAVATTAAARLPLGRQTASPLAGAHTRPTKKDRG